MTAYAKQKQTFDEQVAEAQIREGVKISGRNPTFNREIMMEELQRPASRFGPASNTTT